ncbi:MAG: hypothetical protein H6744_18640 [Deltaproteobacteria bacterium]|nr:hypothetical protein [Deltaproteobacteria bacterium]MCB9788700.1 hypothetical protein [Deltaproteobacteria bacterium]
MARSWWFVALGACALASGCGEQGAASKASPSSQGTEAAGAVVAPPEPAAAPPEVRELVPDPATGRITDETLGVTWKWPTAVKARAEDGALVLSGEGLPEVRVTRGAAPPKEDGASAPAGQRDFGSIRLGCTTAATGDAAKPAEALCESLRPIERFTMEVVGCEARAPHDKLLVAFLKDQEAALRKCLEAAREIDPTLSGLEAGVELRLDGEGRPTRLGLLGDMLSVPASEAYDNCVYRLANGFEYEAADGKEIDSRCKLLLSFYGK